MKITYTNPRTGEQVEFGTSFPMLIETFENTGSSPGSAFLQRAPYQQGASYIGSRLMERSITLQVAIQRTTDAELLQRRSLLTRVFNPLDGEGVLRYERAGVVREIKAVPDPGVEFPSGQGGAPVFRAIIHLLAADPLFYDPEINELYMAAWIGGLSFPLSLPSTFSVQGSEQTVQNLGDVPSPVTIEFNGPATNPKVLNLTTGEHIQVSRELLAGEKLVITTDFGNKSARIVSGETETNAMHYLTDDSVFWFLRPGENVVKYTADAGEEQANVLLTWKNKFLGV